MKDRTEHLTGGIRRVAHPMSIQSKQVHGAHQVTLPQWFRLLKLSKSDSVPLSALAGPLALNDSTVTQIVDRLEKSGLVLRLRVGGDRRMGHVALTEEGRRLASAAPFPVHEALVQRLLALRPGTAGRLVKAIDRLTDLLDSAVGARKSQP